MSSLAMVSLIECINAELDIVNKNHTKIFDMENPEFYITKVEYKQKEDKIYFYTNREGE